MNPWGTKSWLRQAVLGAMVGLLAVVSGAEAADDDPPEDEGDGYESDQGTHLHGLPKKLGDRLQFSLSPADQATTSQGDPIQSGWVDRGQLKATQPVLEGSGLIGTSFTLSVDGEAVTFRIVEARPHRNVYADPNLPVAPSLTAWEYWVQWSSSSSGGPRALCQGNAPALVVPGIWNGYTHSFSTQTFSFACLPTHTSTGTLVGGGVAAKCVDWGYAPWQSSDPRLDKTNLQLPEDDAVRHHLACTAMASADFCGEARPNTLDGTPITMFHTGNVRTEAPSGVHVAAGPMNKTFFFEAAWIVVDAATGEPITDPKLVPVSRVRAQALCLTKKRWSTLPPGGTCSIKGPLWDPRSPKTSRTPGRYCEEYSRDDLVKEGAVLFSYSQYLDAGLYRFKHSSGSKYITTSHFVISDKVPFTYSLDPTVFSNASEYALDTSFTEAFEGPLFKPEVPASVLQAFQTTRLVRYRHSDGSGRYITLVANAPVPQGYVYDGIEGHVDTGLPPVNNVRPLYLWGNAAHYATTTSNSLPGFAPLSGAMCHMPSLEDYAKGP
jgi:hypothetical protein